MSLFKNKEPKRTIHNVPDGNGGRMSVELTNDQYAAMMRSNPDEYLQEHIRGNNKGSSQRQESGSTRGLGLRGQTTGGHSSSGRWGPLPGQDGYDPKRAISTNDHNNLTPEEQQAHLGWIRQNIVDDYEWTTTSNRLRAGQALDRRPDTTQDDQSVELGQNFMEATSGFIQRTGSSSAHSSRQTFSGWIDGQENVHIQMDSKPTGYNDITGQPTGWTTTTKLLNPKNKRDAEEIAKHNALSGYENRNDDMY